jgi:hypothetical protein
MKKPTKRTISDRSVHAGAAMGFEGLNRVELHGNLFVGAEKMASFKDCKTVRTSENNHFPHGIDPQELARLDPTGMRRPAQDDNREDAAVQRRTKNKSFANFPNLPASMLDDDEASQLLGDYPLNQT